MPTLSPKKIVFFIIDLPEFMFRNFLALITILFFPTNKNSGKIKSLSANAAIIESKHKGLRVISIEVMDGFSVYHGVHRSKIKPEAVEKLRLALTDKMINQNIYVSIESGDSKTLKVVIQN